MNEIEVHTLEGLFTDIKVELEAVCIALKEKDVPREAIEHLRGEVDEKAIREQVRETLMRALYAE